MGSRRRWARSLLPVAALAVTALAVAGCAGAAARQGGGGGVGGGSVSGGSGGAGAVTSAQARQAFDAYIAATAKANKRGDGALALSVVTGVQRAAVATAIKETDFLLHGKHSSGWYVYAPPGVTWPFDQYVYGTPTFYLPEQAGYPHWFVASAARTSPYGGGTPPYGTWTSNPGSPVTVTALLLFEQAGAGARWKLGGSMALAGGEPLPALAADSAGYIPTVKLSDTSLLARPDATGALQAAVVDDGPASAASRAVAAGPLTTGMYDSARGYQAGLRPPAGDLYQWHLEGSNQAKFAFRTANGGALVFYAMYLNTVIAVPAYIDKGYPVNPGPAIGFTPDLSPWLSAKPRISLERQDLLSFAAIDPPATSAAGGTAKIQVIASGGTLNYAAGS